MRRTVFALAATLLAMCILSSLAIAQTASINGTVSDSTGALVQQAKVSVRNTATNATREVQTSSTGVYNMSELAAGPYEVTIEKNGFRSVQYQAVTLTVDQALTLNATLEVGSSKEQVTVEGNIVPVDTTDAQLSNVVEHTQMTELPLILRDPYQLVLLSPGVTQSDGLGGISVNGGRERNNNFLLDGADNNDVEVPGGLGGITSQNPDSTEEFRIITNGFAPEYGRNSGAIIDVITRSGTNNLHGDASYFGRWNALGARDFFNHQIDPNTGLVAPQSPYVRNLYSASLGGPIVKNKTFFFVNYQGDRFITALTNSSTVPTAAFKSGVFTYTNPSPGPGCANPCSQAIDISSATGANNGTGVALDPVVQRILSLYPAPNSVNSDGITGTLFFPSESREKDEDATLKMDQKLSKNNNLSARYIYNWFHDPNPFHSDFLPSGLGAISSFDRNQSLAFTLTSTPSTTLINELRASVNRTNNFFGCTGVGVFNSFGFTDQVGRGADFSLPVFSGFGCQGLGDSDGQERRTGTYQYVDTLTKVVGAHTMKFGGEYRRAYSNNFSDFSSRGAFTFNVNTVSNVSVLTNLNPGIDNNIIEDESSMLLGIVDSQVQTQFFTKGGARLANDELDFRYHDLAFFAQDEWKVRPNLTITYGLRWEYYGVPFEAHGNLSDLFQDPSGPAPALPGGGNGFTFTPVGPGTGHQLFDSYYHNFLPRLGFAWDPFKNGKTSIRGGVGAFSDRFYGNLVSDARGNPPFQPFVGISTIGNAATFAQAQLQNQTALPQTVPSPIVPEGSESFPDLFAHNLKPLSLVTWNFGIQHQITSKLVAEANYVGNHSTRNLRVLDQNPPQPSLLNGPNGLVAFCVPNNPANTGFNPGIDPAVTVNGMSFAAGQCSPLTLQRQLLYVGAEFGALPFDAVNNNAFGGIDSVGTFTDTSTGHSWYDGLQAKISEQDFHGLQIQLSYTWSHALDDSSDPLVTTAGNGNYPVDSLDLNREHGNSGFDTRQRAVMNFVYQAPFGRGKNFLSNGVVGRVFEGWELTGIATFQTGLPYDIFGFVDTLHTGNNDRVTLVNPAVLKTLPATGKLSGGGIFTGFNAAAFNPDDGSIPIPFGTPSNLVRNNWYGPGVNNWDLGLNKSISLTERFKLQLRLETYNTFNRPQFAKPSNSLNSPTYGYSFSQVGQNDGTTGARQIQIAGKLTF